MKGLIIMPEFHRNRHEDNYKILFSVLCKEYGFVFQYTDTPVVPIDTDIVITHSIPHHGVGAPQLGSWPIDWLLKIPKKTKVIGYMRDLWNFEVPAWEDRSLACLERYDKILSFSNSFFKRKYPQFTYKHEYFPQYVPYDRFVKLPFNRSPKMKCYLSGASDINWYPLRAYILSNNKHNQVESAYIAAIGDEYARLLSSYLCNATCCLAFRMAVLKHIEIPASGSLLLTDRCDDLDTMGYISGKHYVEYVRDTAIENINYVISNPEKYVDMRKEAREFVLENHTTKNRFSQMKRIIEEVM